MVPVGLKPPCSVAVSFRVTVLAPSGTVVGLGVVLIVGLAALTVTCSLGSSASVTGSLLLIGSL